MKIFCMETLIIIYASLSSWSPNHYSPKIPESWNKSCYVSCPDPNCIGSYIESNKVLCNLFGCTRLTHVVAIAMP